LAYNEGVPSDLDDSELELLDALSKYEKTHAR